MARYCWGARDRGSTVQPAECAVDYYDPWLWPVVWLLNTGRSWKSYVNVDPRNPESSACKIRGWMRRGPGISIAPCPIISSQGCPALATRHAVLQGSRGPESAVRPEFEFTIWPACCLDGAQISSYVGRTVKNYCFVGLGFDARPFLVD